MAKTQKLKEKLEKEQASLNSITVRFSSLLLQHNRKSCSTGTIKTQAQEGDHGGQHPDGIGKVWAQHDTPCFTQLLQATPVR